MYCFTLCIRLQNIATYSLKKKLDCFSEGRVADLQGWGVIPRVGGDLFYILRNIPISKS